MARTRLAIIVPAFNEEARIGPTLCAMVAYFQTVTYSWEIVVIDDGSTDSTLEEVAKVTATEPRVRSTACHPNRGKGAVIRVGFLAADSDFLLLSDADLATPIEEVEKLFEAIGGGDIAIGSRPMKDSRLEIRQPFHREVLGRAFNLAVQLLAVRGIHDTQCGFKLFTDRAAKDVFRRCTINGFGFDFESLMIARDLGLSIAEVPVRWRHQEGSKVVLMRDGPKMLAELVQLRARGKRGRLALRAD